MAGQVPSQLRDLLDAQSGVFARWQAIALGVDLEFVQGRLRSGRWQRPQLGVYAAFSGPVSRDAELWAAVLRAGPQAVLSHQSAAELEGFAPRPSRLIHVTIPLAQHMVEVPGIVAHRSGRLELARHPVRTPPRTRVEETALDLVQLAPTFDDAFGWISRPCNGRFTTPERIRAAMQSRGRVRWRRQLDLALLDVAEGVMSPLEHRWVRDVERAHRLPAAKRQVLIVRDGQPQYLDNLYEELSLGVELDGQAFHPVDERWLDISRDNALAADGILVLRYSWADVDGRRCATAAQFAQVAANRGWAGSPRRCGPTCSVRRRI
jgi:very-short-patch-repair endonuclease